MSLWEAWDERAAEWIDWARAPNHDGFWDGTWPEQRAVLPPPPRLVLDLGCGEGRLGRELLGLGYGVVGAERSPRLARATRQHELPVAVAHADAGRLPFADASVDVVVACMSLHDLDDLDASVREAARVLRPDGHLCAALVHPYATAQDLRTMHTEQPLVTAPYLVERRFDDAIERDGRTMTFSSMHRPLSRYLGVCFGAGLVLDGMREFGSKPIPWLLVLRFTKPA
jgi:SAM-dependent methyltransferase